MMYLTSFQIVLSTCIIALNQLATGQEINAFYYCYNQNTSNSHSLSCKPDQQLYITSERYGSRSSSTGTCDGIDYAVKSCIFEKPNDEKRHVDIGSSCNTKKDCEIPNELLMGLIKLVFNEKISCSRNLSQMLMEVNYKCISGSLIHDMCNGTVVSSKEQKQLQLTPLKFSGLCMCNVRGSNLNIRALQMYNEPSVFHISSNVSNCTLAFVELYNDEINCGKSITAIHVKVNSGYTRRNILWLNLTGEGDITVSCSNTLTGTTVGSSSKVYGAAENTTIIDITNTEINDGKEPGLSSSALIGVVIGCIFFVVIIILSTIYLIRKKHRSNEKNTSNEKEKENEENEYAYADNIDTMENDILHKDSNGETDAEYHHLALDSQKERRNSEICHYDQYGDNTTSEESEYHHLNNSVNASNVHRESKLYDHVTV